MKKLMAIGRVILTLALFALCMAVLAIRTLGYSTLVVTGASMEPSIHKGSLLIVEPVAPSAIALGDVITFEHYGQLTSHRVIAIDTSAGAPAFTTKGDANVAADPEPIHFNSEVGLVRTAIPVAGYAIAYVQGYWRITLTLAAGAVFLTCAALLLFRNEKPRRRIRRAPLVAIDREELWSSHISWLRERAAAQIRAA